MTSAQTMAYAPVSAYPMGGKFARVSFHKASARPDAALICVRTNTNGRPSVPASVAEKVEESEQPERTCRGRWRAPRGPLKDLTWSG